MVHRRSFFLYGCLFFLGIGIAYAQQATVHIRVDGLPFGKNRFSVVAFKDYVSLAPEFLAEQTSVESGMDLSFGLEAPGWVRVTGLGLHHDIIAVPGASYSFSVESPEEGEMYLLHKTDLLDPNDPNIFCDSANVLINRYLMKYNTQLFTGSLAKQTARFCDSLEKVFAGGADALFRTFLSYRLDELRLLAKVWPEPAMYKLRFEGKAFRPENPDYAYAFGEFYKGRLGQILLKHKMSYGKMLINDFRGMDTVMKWISQEPFYPADEVGEGALLLGLTELLKDRNYSRDGILFLFQQFSESSRSATIKSLAGRLYKKYREPVSGEQAPALQVEDKAGVMMDVAVSSNKRTYLCFFDPASQVTASELAAINDLKKNLKDRMVIVPVIINAEKSVLGRMQSTQKLNFELYRNVKSSALADFRLKNDCTCMVLSPDGTYVMPQAPLPAEPDAAVTLGNLAKATR